MSKPFSFFSLRRSGHTPSSEGVAIAVSDVMEEQLEAETVEVSPGKEASPPASEAVIVANMMQANPEGAADHHGESLFFREISQPPPSTPFPQVVPGHSVLASPSGRLESMTPPNRRFPQETPGPAVAAHLASAAKATNSIPSLWPPGGATPTPMPGSWSPGQISSREIAQLRLELRDEIEQVKNDLFGAAMGVSALKDRLDGLEAQVTKAAETPPAAATPSLEDLQAWINERVEQAVQAALERAFEVANQEIAAGLSSSDFYRLPV
ncbi:MAG: hypothetical protein U0984_04430, partial [Prosthecobacter sp.]|nr:hypothetical protein [Prosthecobacter sp.]